MRNNTVATPIVDKNGVTTTRNKRVESAFPLVNRAHNIKVPQPIRNAEEAKDVVDNALELANQALERRERVIGKMIAHNVGGAELDFSDPEVIEVFRVSEVAREIKESIERWRGLEINEREIQRSIARAVGGSLDESNKLGTKTAKV